MSVSVFGKSEYGMNEVIKGDEHFGDGYDIWLVNLRQPLGHPVPYVLTLLTGLAHMHGFQHFHTVTNITITVLKHVTALFSL